ncbi:MAG: flagellar M-ring protein FliF [Alphaproteobacteria bacterium]|nr:flagellar M-ring protein FliF [Alphaproteobacteria bacterium SS10]
MNNFLETLRNLGLPRIAVLVGISVGLLIFFLYISTRLATPEMSLLFDDLQAADAGAITQELDAAGVPYQVSIDGRRIMVPNDQVGRLRMQMAQNGLPTGGSVGFSQLFDDPPGLGVTTKVLNINEVRALQGELEMTINSMEDIRRARVHLVLPQRRIFERDRQDPRASVFLELEQGRSLDREGIAAVQQIVAFSIPDLDPAKVAVSDSRGRTLASPTDASSIAGVLNEADERRRAREQEMIRKIEDQIYPMVGIGNAQVQLTADLNFDRVNQTEVLIDPETLVDLSSQTVEEERQSNEFEGPEPVTVEENIPNVDPVSGPNASAFTSETRAEETINREVSRTERITVREVGEIRRLNISILVDGRYVTDADGNEVYQPRTEQDLQLIANLARGAVGFDQSRGDTIVVENFQFERDPLLFPEEASGMIFGIPVVELRRLAEILILAMVAILVLLLIVRPMINRLLTPAPAAAEGPSDIGLLTDQTGDMQALPGPDGGGDLGDVESQLEQMINISQVEGRVRASSLKKIGEIVEKHPEEAVSIIRNWLYEGKEA